VFTVFGQACFLAVVFVRRLLAGRSIKGEAVTVKTELSPIPAITAVVVSGFVFLPWLSVLLSQTEQARDDYWIPRMNWWTIPKT